MQIYCYMPTQTITSGLRGENTQVEVERGKAFGLWLRTARARKGYSKAHAAASAGVSAQYLGLLENDGMNHRGTYQRPSESIIEKLATALGASEEDGRYAAGYGPKRPSSVDFSSRMSTLTEAQRRIIEELLDSWAQGAAL